MFFKIANVAYDAIERRIYLYMYRPVMYAVHSCIKHPIVAEILGISQIATVVKRLYLSPTEVIVAEADKEKE